jgi:hypothetical protein
MITLTSGQGYRGIDPIDGSPYESPTSLISRLISDSMTDVFQHRAVTGAPDRTARPTVLPPHCSSAVTVRSGRRISS